MKESYGVEVKTRPPRIAYRETVERQGRRPPPAQEADRRRRPVRRSVPAHRTAASAARGFEFVDEVKGGTIPGQFMPAIEKGVRQVLAQRRGRRLPAAGRARDRVRRQVPSGRLEGSRLRRRRQEGVPRCDHEGATRRCSSRSSTSRSTRPSSTWATSPAGLPSKRARINGTDSLRGGEIVVKAQVPLSELEGYAAELKAVTAGRGRYSPRFQPLRAGAAAGAAEAGGGVQAAARGGIEPRNCRPRSPKAGRRIVDPRKTREKTA